MSRQSKNTELTILTRPEVLGIISVLEKNGLLGKLQGMTNDQRVHEFEAREHAGKQLLVAMREATKGSGFDTIIKDEFDALQEHGIKLLYLLIALATGRWLQIKSSASSQGITSVAS